MKKINIVSFSKECLKIVAVLLFAMPVFSLFAAFSEPPTGTIPPNNNVAIPINESGNTQYKTGALGIGGVFQADGLSEFNGDVNIGVHNPYKNLRVGGNTTLLGGVSISGVSSFLDVRGDANVFGQVVANNGTGEFVELWGDGAIISHWGGPTQGLRFGFADDKFTNGWQELMRIGENHVVNIGLSTSIPVNLEVIGSVGIGVRNPGYKLQVGNAGDGTEARANAWKTFSDARLKTNLSKLTDPLDMISQINGYYFNWNTGTDKKRQVGIIAQEVEKVLPEVVSEDKEGIKSVDYGKLAPLLIESIKQLKLENEELKARISALEQK